MSAANNGADAAARVERRWSTAAVLCIALIVGVAAFAGIHTATMPEVQVETTDPRTLHVAGEFVEGNLGTGVEPDGTVTVRAIGQQYSFTPSCSLVPTGTAVHIHATSADVVHGFLIEGTNINSMLVPGYISDLTTSFQKPGEHLMPCHEFCGLGHQGMWGRVRVIDKAQFEKLAADRRRIDCVGQ